MSDGKDYTLAELCNKTVTPKPIVDVVVTNLVATRKIEQTVYGFRIKC